MEKPKAKCHFCKKVVDDDETKCFGCGVNVCDKCDLAGPWGKHDPTAH